jgi:hypothetical protein
MVLTTPKSACLTVVELVDVGELAQANVLEIGWCVEIHPALIQEATRPPSPHTMFKTL